MAPGQPWTRGWLKRRLARKLSPPWSPTDRVVSRVPANRAYDDNLLEREPWRGTNREYGISDTELLDVILSERYNVRISLASKALASTVQVPEGLLMPFHRRFHLRHVNCGGVDSVRRNRVYQWFFLPDVKNQTHGTMIKGVDKSSIGGALLRATPTPYSWHNQKVVLKYLPPDHIVSYFAKSRPAVVLFFGSLPSLSVNGPRRESAVYRSTVRKLMRTYMLEAYCKLQGITRETTRWSDITTFEPIEGMENLEFLLEDHRQTYIIEEERQRKLQEEGVQEEWESLLVKRDKEYYHGIDGVYMFIVRVPLNATIIRQIAYEAMSTVLDEHGYVSPQMQRKYTQEREVATMTIKNRTTEPEERVRAARATLDKHSTRAEHSAYTRTRRQLLGWVTRFNAGRLEQLRQTLTNEDRDDAEKTDILLARAEAGIKQYAADYTMLIEENPHHLRQDRPPKKPYNSRKK
ncbi:uncharacterized protein V1518DRAFT_293177 [Limtongia smithiae]|uniref:uncharacterized protein n=1 Tax=Limtongia smithiae TaxID=1125753 RepID=UPI0034CE05A5